MLEKIDTIAAVQKWKSAPVGTEPLNISIKLTQCGLDQGTEFAEANYRKVVQKVYTNRGHMILMETGWMDVLNDISLWLLKQS